MVLTGYCCCSNRIHLWIQNYINYSAVQIFCIRASSNVWVSHQASRSITSDMTGVWHKQGVVGVPIEPSSDSKIVYPEKFFPSEQVQMSGCRNRPEDPSNLTSHAHGMGGCRSLANRALLRIQNCSSGKFFSIRASSNVWVSRQAEQYTSSDRTYTWY